MMGKVGEFGDANNRNKPSPTWLLLGTYSLSWGEFAAPNQMVEQFGLFTAVFSGGLLDYKMIPTCVDNKHSKKKQ